MKISYAITCCDEDKEVKRLIEFLKLNKQPEDEICVLLDKPKSSQALLDWLYRFSSSNWIFLRESIFKNHFADWKNELTSICTGDYIFQIDADEIPHEHLISILPNILESNPGIDMYLTPRINTVDNITQEHIQKWGWRVDENNWVNYPDYQYRIWKNKSEIKWVNKVHERLEGFKTYVTLPSQEEFSLYHPKTIAKQEKQNNYYNTL
jgi:hypothetical protein